MRPARLAVSAALLLALVVPRVAWAQFGEFGENKIQYRDFQWHVLHGPHVDLYYYPAEEELARVALAYAEQSFTFLTGKFGHAPTVRIPLIVYASHSDFEQTNVLPFVPPESVLGVTEFLKRRVTIPFTGNYAEFRHTIRHELVHEFQLSMFAETARNHPRGHRIGTPLWWSEGLAEYWSAGQDSKDEMFIREIVVAGLLPDLPTLDNISGGVDYALGGAILAWLSRTFGEWRIAYLYRNLWRYHSFDDALAGTYGLSMKELDARYEYAFRKRYYPSVADRMPLDLSSHEIAPLAVKPVAYRVPGDSSLHILYLSPRTGYMDIYDASWDHPAERHAVVHGERTAEFESFHTFASRLDVRDGIAVFTSRYLDRDALVFFDIRDAKVIGRYQFPHLTSLLSPTWAPDGKSVVFSGLSVSGYSDLYRLWLPDGRLEQLTDDRYEDLDPSFGPDGRRLVFASDRTAWGPDGGHNLFLLELGTHALRQITAGPWLDETPRWAANGRIYFSSDRGGVPDIYSIDTLGAGRRETHTLSGAFDPQWVPEKHALLFDGFSGLSWAIFRAPPAPDSATERIALPDSVPPAHWQWPELRAPRYAGLEGSPYTQHYTLDFAGGDAAFAPGIGSAGGAIFLFSDLLGDHVLLAALTSFQASGLGSLLDNLGGNLFYLNQKRRLNWGVGVFRLRGLFYEGDYNTIYDETAYGSYFQLRWPFSRFSRVEAQIGLEHSNRFDLTGTDVNEPRRIGWLAQNYVAFVHDNTLWLSTGPIDGERRNVTLGLTNDLTNGRFDSWIASLDERRYFRIGQRSAYAVRILGYFSAGSHPAHIGIGGTWGLRGYPRYGGVSGTRAVLINQEIRFPISNYLSIGFPFGVMRFPGVQGAVFGDLGGAWTAASHNRGILGSAGFGLRMPVFFPLVLRLDFGWRFEFGSIDGYGLQTTGQGRHFVDFFFGFNY